MKQIYCSFLFVIFCIASISTTPLITNEIAKIIKLIDIRQNNLAKTTMANMHETTAPTVEEINTTESLEFITPMTIKPDDLYSLQIPDVNLKSLEIFDMKNNSKSIDVKEFNVNAIFENTHPSMSVFEKPENSIPLISTLKLSTFKDNRDTFEDAEEINTSTVTEKINVQMDISEAFKELFPLLSALETRMLNETNIIRRILALFEENKQGQLKSTSSSTLQQSESTLSSTLQQSESTPSLTDSKDVQLSDGIRGEAKSGAIYEKTDGVPRTCQLHADCYNLREPEAWCDLKSDEYWIDGGCFCDETIKRCIIELRKNNQLYYTDCRSQYSHHCDVLSIK